MIFRAHAPRVAPASSRHARYTATSSRHKSPPPHPPFRNRSCFTMGGKRLRFGPRQSCTMDHQEAPLTDVVSAVIAKKTPRVELHSVTASRTRAQSSRHGSISRPHNVTVAACHASSKRWDSLVTMPWTDFSADGCYFLEWPPRDINVANGVVLKIPDEATPGATRYGPKKTMQLSHVEVESEPTGGQSRTLGITIRPKRSPRGR